MRSIQRNLTLSVAGVTILLVALAGTALYLYLRHSLLKQFDNLLAAEAQAATGMVQQDPGGRLEFSFPREVEQRARPLKEYFEVYRTDGKLLQRSALLGSLRLAESDPAVSAKQDFPVRLHELESKFWNVRLPGGHPGRATAIHFTAEVEEVETDHENATRPAASIDAGAKFAAVGPTPADPGDDPPPTTRPRAATSLVLVLTEDQSAMEETLDVLLSALLVAAAVLSGGASMAVSWSIRRGLLPLRMIGHQAKRIGPASLDYRFAMDGMPAELIPLCRRLNELLQRLQEGFSRERRFTSAVAHELRTPISELRALGEVAMKWPEDAASTAENFQEVLEIAHQMARIVTAMLTIARSETGCELFNPAPVELSGLVAEAHSPFKSTAIERHLSLEWVLPAEAHVISDRSMLLQLLGNLFSNAVEHTSIGGCVECRLEATAGAEGSGWELTLTNQNDSLDAADMPHLFEPFWRKDAARTSSDHSGLGLAVVGAYAKVIGAAVSARLPRPDRFCISVTIPAAPNVAQST